MTDGARFFVRLGYVRAEHARSNHSGRNGFDEIRRRLLE